MNDFVNLTEIKNFLDIKYEKFNNPNFIENDPVQIPHMFKDKNDIEISGFITAIIAWGQRKTIINDAKKIIKHMDNSPYDFIINMNKKDLKNFNDCGHRTFMPEDLKFFLKSLQNIYHNHGGLESIFNNSESIYEGLISLHKIFFSLPHEQRTQKHLANVAKGSAAKRINMFLRWMIRNDKRGVDFGLWTKNKPSHLYIPLDLHSGNIARLLGILKRTQNDWKAVEELTEILRTFDPNDPVKYDFSLFGVGVNEDF